MILVNWSYSWLYWRWILSILSYLELIYYSKYWIRLSKVFNLNFIILSYFLSKNLISFWYHLFICLINRLVVISILIHSLSWISIILCHVSTLDIFVFFINFNLYIYFAVRNSLYADYLFIAINALLYLLTLISLSIAIQVYLVLNYEFLCTTKIMILNYLTGSFY